AAFESGSLIAIQAAVRAGVGIATLLPGNVEAGIMVLDPRTCRLPAPPRVELALYRRPPLRDDPGAHFLANPLWKAAGSCVRAAPERKSPMPNAAKRSNLLAASTKGDPNGNRPHRAVSLDTADKQCHDGRKRYMFGGATLEGGIDDKRRSANARAYRDSL